MNPNHWNMAKRVWKFAQQTGILNQLRPYVGPIAVGGAGSVANGAQLIARYAPTVIRFVSLPLGVVFGAVTYNLFESNTSHKTENADSKWKYRNRRSKSF